MDSRVSNCVLNILTDLFVGACGMAVCRMGGLTHVASAVQESSGGYIAEREIEDDVDASHFYKGFDELCTVTVDGVERKYLIHVPQRGGGGGVEHGGGCPVVLLPITMGLRRKCRNLQVLMMRRLLLCICRV